MDGSNFSEVVWVLDGVCIITLFEWDVSDKKKNNIWTIYLCDDGIEWNNKGKANTSLFGMSFKSVVNLQAFDLPSCIALFHGFRWLAKDHPWIQWSEWGLATRESIKYPFRMETNVKYRLQTCTYKNSDIYIYSCVQICKDSVTDDQHDWQTLEWQTVWNQWMIEWVHLFMQRKPMSYR